MGYVSTGLNEETILAHMEQRKHSDMANSQLEAEPCCICQVPCDHTLLNLHRLSIIALTTNISKFLRCSFSSM